MRISDWSSDVCSSDLDLRIVNFEHQGAGQFATIGDHRIISGQFILELFFTAFFDPQHFVDLPPHRIPILKMDADMRSEEHASELQSLMRISYAVFCLKKKIDKVIYYFPATYMNTDINVHSTN